jgi:carbamoylphosphate synthase large subunit
MSHLWMTSLRADAKPNLRIHANPLGHTRMTARKPKILLSEGSSLSSREAITALGLAGHRVELVSSDPMCLGRFSRFVSRVHRAPASGADPDGYLAAVLEIVKTENIDALIPVHEQAYLFAAGRKQLPADLGIALADFETFEQVQSKASFAALLTRLNIPQPATEIIRSADEFAAQRPYPFFVKAAFGTASARASAMHCCCNSNRSMLSRMASWSRPR